MRLAVAAIAAAMGLAGMAAQGQVQVRWVIDGDGKGLQLTWRESGGPPIAVPSPPGFGLRLIEEGVALEIGGRVELRQAPEGLICSWHMKLP